MKKFNPMNLIVLAIEMLCLYGIWINTPAPAATGYGQLLLDKPTTSSLSLDDNNNNGTPSAIKKTDGQTTKSCSIT